MRVNTYVVGEHDKGLEPPLWHTLMSVTPIDVGQLAEYLTLLE